MKKSLIFSSLLVSLPRSYKKLIQLIFDFFALSAVYVVSVGLADGVPVVKSVFVFGLPYVFISLVGFNITGIYKAVVRYSGARLLESIVLVQLITTAFLGCYVLVFSGEISLVALLLLFLLPCLFSLGASLNSEIIFFATRRQGSIDIWSRPIRTAAAGIG